MLHTYTTVTGGDTLQQSDFWMNNWCIWDQTVCYQLGKKQVSTLGMRDVWSLWSVITHQAVSDRSAINSDSSSSLRFSSSWNPWFRKWDMINSSDRVWLGDKIMLLSFIQETKMGSFGNTLFKKQMLASE